MLREVDARIPRPTENPQRRFLRIRNDHGEMRYRLP